MKACCKELAEKYEALRKKDEAQYQAELKADQEDSQETIDDLLDANREQRASYDVLAKSHKMQIEEIKHLRALLQFYMNNYELDIMIISS